MTLKSGFHNSINGDRKYNAEDMNRPYKDIVSNGVFANPSTHLQVLESADMVVSVSPGGGLFGSGWAYNDAPVLLTLDQAEATLSRIDAVIVKRDDSELVRNSTLEIKKGTPAEIPVAPQMTRDDLVNEYCLATILIAPGTTSITQSLITDTRPDTRVCGWVTGLIDQVDTSTLFAQWESAYEEQYGKFMSEFSVWWENVKDALKDDESASAEIIRLGVEKADKVKTTLTLPLSDWTLENGYYYQTVNVEGVGTNDIIFVGPDKENMDTYANAGILCVDQGEGTLTFRANTIYTVNVIIINMGV